MKKVFSRTAVIVAALFPFVCISSGSFAAESSSKDKSGENKFTQGKKGEARKALEETAGKKIPDVKVPEPPKPTRVP